MVKKNRSSVRILTQKSKKPEAATGGVLLKKVFLEISQNSQQKHLCQSLFFNKVAGLRHTDTGLFL